MPYFESHTYHRMHETKVDDCLKKYMWSRDMMGGLAKLKREGRPMPKTIDEFQQLMGTQHVFVVHWSNFTSLLHSVALAS